MKYLIYGAVFLFGVLFAAEGAPSRTEQPLFDWSLLWSGGWDEKNLTNRGEFRLGFPVTGLVLRGQALDKRSLNFDLEPPWGLSNGVSAFSGGLYHTPTGSRLLYGVLDEWGLSARIRNPWIRSAPFAENHKPLVADLKTTVSATKEPEAYLYLSTPRLALLPGSLWRGFVSAQTGTEEGFWPDFSGGLEARIGDKTTVLLEGFYSGGELPARTSKSWFADQPPLPEREYDLYAMGLLVQVPWVSFSGDWAYSRMFAQGKDMYANVGIRVSPSLGGSPPKDGPWSISLAADGAGEHFTGRDGGSPGAGFRTAGKFEWKGSRSSLFRLNTTLRSSGIGEDFNRSSIGMYYRFPGLSAAERRAAGSKDAGFPLRVSRVSLSTERDAVNPGKTLDSIHGTVGLSLNLPPVPLPGFAVQGGSAKKPVLIGSPLSIAFSGSLTGKSAIIDEKPSLYPWPQSDWDFDSAKADCELAWSPGIFQFKTKAGYKITAKQIATENEGQWNAAITTGVRFKYGRFSVKAAAADFPDKWNCTVSWRLEKK